MAWNLFNFDGIHAIKERIATVQQQLHCLHKQCVKKVPSWMNSACEAEYSRWWGLFIEGTSLSSCIPFCSVRMSRA